jgi:heme/copper-type cytochrome/quinol oxidase subunit 1
MDYVISHFWTIIIGTFIVAFFAVLWWYLMDKNARLKRERAQAKIAEAKRRKENQ